MTKSKTSSNQQIKAIRSYVEQGLSANRIQKRLQKQNIGMRRKTLLEVVRKIKCQKPKANRSKYTPRKYRRAFGGASYFYKERGFGFFGKKIAGYGTVNGKPRRIQVDGDGNQLYKVMLLVSKYPPKQQFLTIDAQTILNNPWKYLSIRERWDARPLIDS